MTNEQQPLEAVKGPRTILAVRKDTLNIRPTGISMLDTMLGGGMKPGSTWLIDGQPGAGKSLVSAHFLAEGIARGEPGLYITAAESPASVLQSFAQNWPKLEKAVAQRQLAVLDPSPFFTEMRLLKDRTGKTRASVWDEVWRFVQDVVKQSRNQGAKRIVIDPVTPLLMAYDSAIELWDATHTFVNALNETLGATTLLTHSNLPNPVFEAIGANLRALCGGVLQLERGEDTAGNHALSLRVVKHRHQPIMQYEAHCLIGEHGHIVAQNAAVQRGRAA